MFKKGVVVTAIFIFSTLLQLVSQIVVTRLFGATFELDAFLAAVAVPTILVTVIYSTINDAFLPAYTHFKHENSKKADEYFTTHLVALTIFSCAVTIGGIVFSYPLTALLYGARGSQFIFSVTPQTMWMMLSIPVSVIATFLGSYYYARKHFLRFPIAQLVGTITNLGIIALLSPMLGIWSLVIGFVINIIFQIVCVIPKGLSFTHSKDYSMAPFFASWIPLIIGALALRSDTLLIRSFGAQLPDGSLVYLNLISKIFALATGMVTIGIQILLLPHLVEQVAKKEYARVIRNVNKAKLVAIAVSAITIATVWAIAPLVVHLLFVGGKFTSADADNVTALIPLFLIPAIGWGVTSVFTQPLLAIQKHSIVGSIQLGALIVAWGSAMLVQSFFGPLEAIRVGLSVLLFSIIIASEILWQKHKPKVQ